MNARTTFLLLVLLLFSFETIAVNIHMGDSSIKIQQQTLQKRTPTKKVSVTQEIQLKMNQLMDNYSKKPNTADTWKSVKNEASNILYDYYRAGKLMGTKPDQAYFVKIGYDTMTSADIKTGKMIMLVGLAPLKPAEFEILTFERNVVGN